ncbi:MAG: peptidoglycan DD-metalloendopeptidase family protein [Oscillibacter sp.]|nr:peptidoglycan DD-metalloendopeptidase family protein [Oscillibacter sp.]
MEKGTRRLPRILAALLCALILFASDAAPVLAKVTQADIDALKGDASELDRQQSQIKSKIKALENDKSQAVKKKNLLDDQIANTAQRITNVEAQIADYTELIAQAELDLADAEEREAAQYALFCKRVRAMEEQGTVSYLAILFRATSFSDLLGRLDVVHEIMDADNRIMESLRTLQAEISERKAGLEANKAASEAAKSELTAQKAELARQRDEANALVSEIKSNEAEYQSQLKELEAERARIQNQIADLTKKLADQMAAEGKSFNSNPGGYIWPVDSRYITSTMGGRASPGGIGSTNHKGTDIGRVGYTSPVYASKAGTVIISEKSSSYGNYVVIAHGTGNTTLYAHLSSRSVKVGDYVKQGQTIGITGSTGHSTGPHLHFEVKENGVLVNPLNHGAQPRKGYLTGYTLSGS